MRYGSPSLAPESRAEMVSVLRPFDVQLKIAEQNRMDGTEWTERNGRNGTEQIKID